MNIIEFYKEFGDIGSRRVVSENTNDLDYYDVSDGNYYPRYKQAVYYKNRVSMTDVEYLVKTLDLLQDKSTEEILDTVSGRDKIYIRRMLKDVLMINNG